jgi:hypothetical protein
MRKRDRQCSSCGAFVNAHGRARFWLELGTPNTIRDITFAALSFPQRPLKGYTMLERTITQNSALYLSHHKILKQRRSIFRRMRVAERNRLPDLQRPVFGEAYFVPRFFQDNGR